MRQILISILFVFLIFGCKKNNIESIKRINIHVESENQKSIDSIQFEILKAVPAVFSIVSTGYSDSSGNCTLTFNYNLDNFSSYSFKIAELIPKFTYGGDLNKHKIYKLKSSIPEFDFSKASTFNLNIVLIPAAELQIYCSDSTVLKSDFLQLKILESDSVIYNDLSPFIDVTNKLNIYLLSQRDIKINYGIIRNGFQLSTKSADFTFNDFELKILKIDL